MSDTSGESAHRSTFRIEPVEPMAVLSPEDFIDVRRSDEIGGALSGFGGYLRCRTCGHSQDLGDPGARVMGGGWPKCCTHTMEWITQRQIDDDERPAR